MGKHMGLWSAIFLLLLAHVFLHGSATELLEKKVPRKIQTAPNRYLENSVIDGRVTENGFGRSEAKYHGFDERSRRVPVPTVALFTLAMAAATGLGAVPFFFVELEPQWAGICNGLAAGVMLAASFDLVQEGQNSTSGSWVVIGILSGGIFIWLCKKVNIVPLSFAYFLQLLYLWEHWIKFLGIIPLILDAS